MTVFFVLLLTSNIKIYCECEGKIAALFKAYVIERWSVGLANMLHCARSKKIKTPCSEAPKSINPIYLFICSHCQVSSNVSKRGLWLAHHQTPKSLSYFSPTIFFPEALKVTYYVSNSKQIVLYYQYTK